MNNMKTQIKNNKVILEHPSSKRVSRGLSLKLKKTDNVTSNLRGSELEDYVIATDIIEGKTEYPLPPWLKKNEVEDVIVFSEPQKLDRKGNPIS